MTENAIAKEVVDAAFRIHTTLGPGLLESVYQTVLAYELGRRGLRAVSQQAIPVVYDGIRMDTGFRADLVVEDKVRAEIKRVWLLWNDAPFDGIKPSLILFDVELPIAIKIS